MTLRVLVCVKAALDPNQALRVSGTPPAVGAEGPARVYTISPADRAALEMALKLKETAGTQVTVLSLGGPECKAILLECMAGGADPAVHLACDEILDPWSAAKLVAAEVARRGFDLVLCGDASADDGSGVFGPFLGEILGIPQVFRAVELSADLQAGQLTILRLLERGDRQRVSCPLPAVVSISALGSAPRYVSVLRVEETDGSAIERIEAHPEASENGLKVVEIGLARPRPRRMATPGAGLSAAQRMNLMMRGSEAAKPGGKDKIFEGSVEAAVERIIQYLQEQGFL